MFKVAILGCENSHANAFLKAVIKEELVKDVEFVGVYSDDREAAEKLNAEFGVPVADTYDQFVGQVDGIIITARHGDDHYKFAKPYISSGIPMFIDKPITCSEEDAQAFKDELVANKVPVCGGSVCGLATKVMELKKLVAEGTYGKPLGGYVRAPMNIDNPYGGIFFYTQHLAQAMMEIFGYYPNSVQMFKKECENCTSYSGVVHYDSCDVSIAYTTNYYLYVAAVSFGEHFVGGEYGFEGGFEREFMEFYDLLHGKAQPHSYEDFFAPVYFLNAVKRSLESGAEEVIHRGR